MVQGSLYALGAGHSSVRALTIRDRWAGLVSWKFVVEAE